MKFFLILAALASAIGAIFTNEPYIKMILFIVCLITLSGAGCLQLKSPKKDKRRIN